MRQCAPAADSLASIIILDLLSVWPIVLKHIQAKLKQDMRICFIMD